MLPIGHANPADGNEENRGWRLWIFGFDVQNALVKTASDGSVGKAGNSGIPIWEALAALGTILAQRY
jgi:hypothetical protein